MPGFILGVARDSFGDKFPTDQVRERLVYNYTWELNKLFDDTKLKSVRLKDVSLPSFTVQKESIIGSSLEYKYAGNVSFDDVNLSFYDTNKLIDDLITWRSSIWTEDGGLNIAQNYKKDTTIISYYSDGTFAQAHTLIGSWPSSIKHGSLTYTTSDIKIVDITVTYDWAREFGSKEDFDNQRVK